MALLTARNLGFSYVLGSPVFTGANFTVGPRDRIGIAGANGSGKTTLLRILAGELEPVEGAITRQRGIAVRTLSRGRAEGVSCGEQARLELEQLLREPAALFLLDEPTNHLDLEARRWLAARLERHPAAFVIISHDRAFLNRVTTQTLWLERGKAEIHAGGYDFALQQRGQNRSREWSEYQAQQRRIQAAKQAAERRASLAREMVEPPAGVRHSQDFYARKASKVARTGRILRERVLMEGEKTKPWEEKEICYLDFRHIPSSPPLLAYANGLGCGYGGKAVIEGVTFAVERGQRWALEGRNGCGKTTLFHCLRGTLAPLAGEVKLSAAARVAYYSQQQDSERLDGSPLEYCLEVAGETQARTVLACLKVPADLVCRKLRSLSPAERCKAAIARMLLGPHNLLIFDEPTNHLEIEAQAALAEALQRFPGAILFTSHDEWFRDEIATHRLSLSAPCMSS